MKPHIKVIQRNGVDIFVTSSMKMKPLNKQRYPIVNNDELTSLANNFLKKRNLPNIGALGYGYYFAGSKVK